MPNEGWKSLRLVGVSRPGPHPDPSGGETELVSPSFFGIPSLPQILLPLFLSLLWLLFSTQPLRALTLIPQGSTANLSRCISYGHFALPPKLHFRVSSCLLSTSPGWSGGISF